MTENNQVTLTINGKEVQAEKGTPIIEAARQNGIEIPHFCYHKRLSVPANCRMCLVEIKGAPKPTPSCYTPVMQDMEVHTDSPVAKKAQKGVMELLLINHPLDCPICDQGGMCDLQDMAVGYGSDRSHYQEEKRAVEDKNLGPLIRTVMTRCIHCTRCIRFATEVAGVPEMGATGRGENMKVGTYVEKALESELSGNMIDLCPVGALCSKPYSFTARPWELEHTDSIDTMDGLGSAVRVYHRGGKVMRIDPIENNEINEEWLSDAGRFSYDGLGRNRLTTPMLRKNGKLSECGWPQAFEAIKEAVAKAKPATTMGLAGEQLSAEDLFSFNAFMKQTLKTDNVDARHDGSTVTAGPRAKYVFGGGIQSVDKADLVLLVGSDPRLEAPVLNARIRKNVMNNGLKVLSVGAHSDLTYPVETAENTAQVIEQIAAGEHKFSKLLEKAKHPMIIVGAKATLARKDAPQLFHKLHHIADAYGVVTKAWYGFNVLNVSSTRVAALDLEVYPEQKGKDTDGILTALKGGKVDLLVLYGEGNTHIPVADLEGAKTTIFIGTHKSAYAHLADIVLPSATYTEKSALWVNTEGRVQEARKAVNPPMQAKEDWKIFRALSGELGKALPFDSQQQLRALMIKKAPVLEQVGELVTPTWEKFGVAGKVKNEAFELPIQQFYKTNAIMRASQVMDESQELAEARKAAQQTKKAS